MGVLGLYSPLYQGEEEHLELIAPEHAGPLFELIDGNREHLRRWLPWVDGVSSSKDTEAFIEKAMAQHADGNGPTYVIMDGSSVAGVVSFHPVDWPNRNAELGYWLGREFTGKGLMTEACRYLLKQGFQEMGLNRIEIRCASGNAASRAVAKRLGMVLEGLLREEELLYDRYVDHCVYSILKREYQDGTH